LEYPDFWGGIIDLPPDPEGASADLLLQELRAADGEDQIMLRAGKRLVPRLVRCTAARLAPQPVTLVSDATYWIVGGLGGIGLKTATALVQAGARHLVLTGRQAAATPAPEILDSLRQHAEVVILASDVTQETDVEAVLLYIRHHLPPLKGVIHAAAVFEDAVLANSTWEQFHRVLQPKTMGAWLLHRYTQELDVDFFVMFSSVLSLWGAAGQAAYAAANSFLDALASYRRAAGLPATVVNWGPWDGVGLTERWGRAGAMLWQQRGTTQLAPEMYLEVLLHSLHKGPMQVVVCQTHWPTFLNQFREIPPLYRELAPAVAPVGATPESGDDRTRIVDLMRRYASQVLGLDGRLEVTQPLHELGLDSLLAVNLANQLRQALNVTVPPALLLKGVSLNELLDELFPELAAVSDDSRVPEGSTARVEGNGWLIMHHPRPDARVRLFCFPFAGGGAATFRAWTPYLDTNIELVAIEPPGRQTRIDEPPLRDMTTFLAQCIPTLLPFLDKPFAVYGHCLGALTLFETVRTLIREHQKPPMHIFVSGARPPDQLQRQQSFETHLLERLLALPNYNLFEPIYRQPDDVFGEVIRQFNIPATEAFLQDPELRHLLLPVIRAEFEMSSTYRYVPELPWEVPITCLTGVHDAYVSPDNARAWGRFTSTQFQLISLESEHFLVVDDDQVLIQVINRELVHSL
jgi:surfactin synthase thioesterase subunit/NAD(P)-dependent dehydrogenase (short-subunit alcohol dehydrogenase family)/acyl carrier protein